MKKKLKKNDQNRAKANFEQFRIKSDKISSYKYDELPGVIQKDTVDDNKENIADVTLRRMQRADVFRSAKQTIRETNTNPRRYQ